MNIFHPEKISERNEKTRGENRFGWQKKHLLIPGLPKVLALLFKILCFTSHFPESWRKNRTTLIPKPNKDAGKAENWRPITIGPIRGRIFSSILGGKISIVQNVRQKGFSGCKINDELMNAGLVQS